MRGLDDSRETERGRDPLAERLAWLRKQESELEERTRGVRRGDMSAGDQSKSERLGLEIRKVERTIRGREAQAEWRARRAEERGSLGRERTGHRREIDPRRERVHLNERTVGALVDVACYRVVARRDVVDDHFGGHPYAANRGIEFLERRGMIQIHQAEGPRGTPFQVLTTTPDGEAAARDELARRGFDSDQRTWGGAVKPAELRHDTAIYRAGRDEARRLEERGAEVIRIRIDAELKSAIARATEQARSADGREAAERARAEEARALHLPLDENGAVLYPDVQLEYIEPDGVTRGYVNVEVVTEQYRAGEISAKAEAGFRMHGTSKQAAGLIARALDRSAIGSGGGGGRGRGRGRDRGVMEL